MANKVDSWPENTSGKFYVDKNCIACDTCFLAAPGFFQMADDHSHAFLCKQPGNADEEALCTEALSNCPVEAIGSDGNV